MKKLSQSGERITLVIQSKTKVLAKIEGYESMLVMYLLKNMKKNHIAVAFDNGGKWLGTYRLVNGFPEAFEADEELTFKDFYSIA